MSDLPARNGSPATLELDGVTYKVAPIWLCDWAEIDQWIASKWTSPLEQIKPRLEGLSEEDRRYLLDRAYEDSKHGPPTFMSYEGMQYLASGEAVAFMLQVSLKHYHPDITFEMAKKLVMQAGLNVINALLQQQNFPEEVLSKNRKGRTQSPAKAKG